MENQLILMVDGELETLESNEQELARCSQGAFSFMKARTIAEARGFLPQKPNVVVMETVLPDGSGFDLMRDIRMTASAFVVVLTTSEKLEDEVEWLVCGADEYISKTCPARLLYARILARLKTKLPRTGDASPRTLNTKEPALW